jgi:5'-3' exonuclease
MYIILFRVDLLPQLPSLEISNGGLDSLLYVYKRILPYLKGYISENGTEKGIKKWNKSFF